VKRLKEILARQAAIQAELTEIGERSEPLDTDGERADALLKEWDELDAERKPLAERAARIEAVRSAALDVPADEDGDKDTGSRSRNLEDGDGTKGTGSRSRRKDPFADLGERSARLMEMRGSEIASRAKDAVEFVERSNRLTHDQAEIVTRLLEGRDPRIGRRSAAGLAEHVLRTGSEAYRAAFEDFLSTGNAQRAAMSLTDANGGYLVPFTLDPTIILTNAGSANPFRQIANVKMTTTDNWNGVTSAGVTAEWTAEAAQAADASPTVGALQITPARADAWIQGSFEVLSDSNFETQLPELLRDAKDRLEEAAFATGDGSNKPYGVVTGATTVASATAATYAVADVYAVQNALPARWRGPNARTAWVANLAVINATRQFDTNGGSAFWANLGMGQPERLLGAPIYESTTMAATPATAAAKTLLLGDFSQYVIVDRIGMSVMYEPLVKGANQRPTGEAGWFAMWRVGAKVATANAFRVLTIGTP